eukprot:CAMPEP_0172925742 /NCGR_PEP_ID=MMETSP1075-20121228/214273_1 /TAXON_ID=2916 /ORGANISM="Ceratium fusus, Strain PA161109" /LENGTH=42 /DNA_ID= /DNA_START= /DNA_END= /DNA_ORIENTATION=
MRFCPSPPPCRRQSWSGIAPSYHEHRGLQDEVVKMAMLTKRA